MSELSALFAPRGIAVIGASSDPGKLGSVMARNLEAFGGPVIRVSPTRADPQRRLYRTALDGAEEAGAPLDLAILCVPARVCATALEQAAAAGVRAAVVCAGGFAEAGPEGARHQQALDDVATEHGVRILGPNTSGFLVPAADLFATFVPAARLVPAGGVGVVAASGGVNHVLAFQIADAGAGVSVAVGLGNASNVGPAEVIRYLAADPNTRAIAVHVESVADGPALIAAIRDAAAVKPLAALVVGRAEVAQFAQSHTGALATSWRLARSVLAQAGAVVVDDERELVEAVTALSCLRLTPKPRPGVAVVTAQAGPGLILLDNLRHHDIEVPSFDEGTRMRLAELLPPMTFMGNPVDTGRPGPTFGDVLGTTTSAPGIDLVASYTLLEPDGVDLVAEVSRAGRGMAPVVVAVGGIEQETSSVRRRLHELGIHTTTSPTALATAIRALVGDAQARSVANTPSDRLSIPGASLDIARSTTRWTESAAKDLLDTLGISTPRRVTGPVADVATLALANLSLPVVAKVSDGSILHKTERDGVRLGLASEEELTAAIDQLHQAGARHVLVEEMAPTGVDLIVGARRDPVFGPVVLLGLGGTVAEAVADVALRAAPLSEASAVAMMEDLAVRDLLHGWRGGPAVDPTRLGHVLRLLGQVLLELSDFAEVEINPLRLTSRGLIALDAVVVTKEQ